MPEKGDKAAYDKAEVQVEVDGRRLTISSLDKVLYPRTGTTKAEVLHYYATIAPVMQRLIARLRPDRHPVIAVGR